MKKFYSKIMMALIATSIVLTSCGDKDAPGKGDDKFTADNAKITLKNLNEESFDHAKGSTVKFNIDAFASEQIAKVRIEKVVTKVKKSGKLKFPKDKLKVWRANNDFETKDGVENASFVKDFEYVIKEETGTEVKIVVEVKDKGTGRKGREKRAEATYSFVVGTPGATIVNANGNVGSELGELITLKKDIVLGNRKSAKGSYLSSSDGSVFLSADACANVAKIDITLGSNLAYDKIYMVSPRTRATGTFAGVDFNFGQGGCEDNTRETFFMPGTEEPSAATATTVDEYDFTSDAEKFIEIAEGKSYSFITQDNKRGVLKIVKIEAKVGNEKVVSLEYTVQK